MIKTGRPKKQDVAVKEETTSTSLTIERSMHERLRKMNYETREPMQSIIRRGIELALKAGKY